MNLSAFNVLTHQYFSNSEGHLKFLIFWKRSSLGWNIFFKVVKLSYNFDLNLSLNTDKTVVFVQMLCYELYHSVKFQGIERLDKNIIVRLKVSPLNCSCSYNIPKSGMPFKLHPPKFIHQPLLVPFYSQIPFLHFL